MSHQCDLEICGESNAKMKTFTAKLIALLSSDIYKPTL